MLAKGRVWQCENDHFFVPLVVSTINKLQKDECGLPVDVIRSIQIDPYNLIGQIWVN